MALVNNNWQTMNQVVSERGGIGVDYQLSGAPIFVDPTLNLAPANETELATLTGMPTNNLEEIKLAADNFIKRSAGNSFIGSFSHYYAAGEDVPIALRHANQYAAMTVTKKGGLKSLTQLRLN